MTGPYERELHAELGVTQGRIELRCEDVTVTALVLRGEAEITLLETFDAAVMAYGQDDPVRYLGAGRRLRVTVEADLDGMTIYTRPGPGNG